MSKLSITSFLLALICSLPIWADIKISDGDGASIEDLKQDKSLVTVVLKSGAMDKNLIITGVHKETISFDTPDGDSTAYPISHIQQIKVQDRRETVPEVVLPKNTLNREQLTIARGAADRAFQIFEYSQGNQEVRMQAAALIALMGDLRGREAHNYLLGLAQSNDTPTAVLATLQLYSIGDPIDPIVVKEGFLNGNRNIRTLSALLAGLSGDQQFLKNLRGMLSDPSAEVFPNAARALGRLNDRGSFPTLYRNLSSLSQPKSEASINALTAMGGDDVMSELRRRLPNAKQIENFRMTRILYALGDEDAEYDMRKKGLTTVAFEPASGLLLGENGEWDGVNWIREYLDKRKDPNYRNLIFRAHLGYALYDSQEANAKIVFQKLMGMTESQVYEKGFTDNSVVKGEVLLRVQMEVCRLLGVIGDKHNLTILNRAMKHEDPRLSLAACSAIVAIARPEYRARSKDYYEYIGYREIALADFFK